MLFAGLDVSTKAVDAVLLDVDTLHAAWHHYPLPGPDAWSRIRMIRDTMPARSWWADQGVVQLSWEQPAGKHGSQVISAAVGAVLACLPIQLPALAFMPSSWRKHVGLPGNASKDDVRRRAIGVELDTRGAWTQDACDAYCIALACLNVCDAASKEAA